MATALTKSPSRLPLVIVDDSPEIRTMFEVIADFESIPVVTARDGYEALRLIRDLKEGPGVLFVDRNLPGMSGPDFIKIVRESHLADEAPIILISASAGEEDYPGITSKLTKPFSLAALTEIIRESAGKLDRTDRSLS